MAQLETVIDFTQLTWSLLDKDYIEKWNTFQAQIVLMQQHINAFGQAVEQEQADTLQQAGQIKADVQSIYSDQVVPARDQTQTLRDEAQQFRDEAQQIAAGDVVLSALQPAQWQAVNTDMVLATNGWYALDFSAGPLSLTLPGTPTVNDVVMLYNSVGGAAGSTIARNGNTIMGLAEDLVLDFDFAWIRLVFNGSDWRVVS